MASRNPVFNDKVFARSSGVLADQRTMTVNGTVSKTFILILIAAATGLVSWNAYFNGANVTGYLYGGAIGGLIVALITVFRPQFAHVTAPIYAALEGLALGAISAIYHDLYAGLPIQAIGLTLAVLAIMLVAYTTGAIRATEKFRLGVVAATGAIMLLYLVSFVMSFFGARIAFIHDSGPVGIIFSLVVVGIAALNLILDFDFIEQGVKQGAPARLEWFGAFGLMVTLVWLYLEILRLLGKMRR